MDYLGKSQNRSGMSFSLLPSLPLPFSFSSPSLTLCSRACSQVTWWTNWKRGAKWGNTITTQWSKSVKRSRRWSKGSCRSNGRWCYSNEGTSIFSYPLLFSTIRPIILLKSTWISVIVRVGQPRMNCNLNIEDERMWTRGWVPPIITMIREYPEFYLSHFTIDFKFDSRKICIFRGLMQSVCVSSWLVILHNMLPLQPYVLLPPLFLLFNFVLFCFILFVQFIYFNLIIYFILFSQY